MSFHPGILALLANALLSVLMICFCCYMGMRIIRYWNIQSGSEYQLELERRTYLISTVMMYVMGFQFLSFFLFIYTADSLSHLFTGAMCAAGTLNVNNFGYPTLIIKLIVCVASGVWLVINSTDNKAPDYPLIRKKYKMLLFIAPLMLTEAVLLSLYFLRLNPDIITSCCSVIFSESGNGAVSGFLNISSGFVKTIFFLSAAATTLSALRVYITQKGAVLLGAASLLHLPVSILALISFISISIYELPTHHCPFCILHGEYHFVGYMLYLSALLGTTFGVGAGVINPAAKISSLKRVVPRTQKKLAFAALLATIIFLLISSGEIIFSNLRM